jgi:hypothetical protein
LGLSKGKIRIFAPYLVGLCIFPFSTTIATMGFCLATKKKDFPFYLFSGGHEWVICCEVVTPITAYWGHLRKANS